jgi:hypothetical protein
MKGTSVLERTPENRADYVTSQVMLQDGTLEHSREEDGSHTSVICMTYGRQEEAFKALKERKRDNKVLHPHNPIKENGWIIVSSRRQTYENTR